MSELDREDFEVIAKDIVFKGHFQVVRYRLRYQNFAGDWTEELSREVFERGQIVSVLLYDPARDKVVLLQQFRAGAYAANWYPWLYEVVAGSVDESEAHEAAARRHIAEEAGCTVGELVKISNVLASPGVGSEVVHMYVGNVDCAAMGELHISGRERNDIRAFTLVADEAISMVKDGRISGSVAMISLLWLATEKENLQKRWN